MLSNTSTFHATLEQLRKGHVPHRQASGVCFSEQPLSTCPILAGIQSRDLLVRSKALIPQTPSDLNGTAVPFLVCPGNETESWRGDPPKLQATLEQKGGKQPKR